MKRKKPVKMNILNVRGFEATSDDEIKYFINLFGIDCDANTSFLAVTHQPFCCIETTLN